jgi:antitoxin (DNA-binding transcriptional repressor) of toxin-antitoxin stability system
MTILVDIENQAILAEIVARIEAGEEVLLTRDGETVAAVTKVEPPAKPIERVPGLFAHLGPMDDPEIFFHPDPEFIELAEARDEDDFYRPPPTEK